MRDTISKSQMVAIRNAVTDEIETAKVTVNIQRDPLRYKENFTVLFQAVNVAIAKNIKPVTAKLLLFLVSVMDYQNRLDWSVQELSKELGYTDRNVYTALNELEKFKIILRIENPKDKRRNLITINPLQSWKGKVKERNSFMSSLTQEDKNQLQLPFEELQPKPNGKNIADIQTQEESINNFENEKK